MTLAIVVSAIVFLIFLLFALIYASRYVKAGPNEVLVISGLSHKRIDPRTGSITMIGSRIVLGSGTFVWPILEKCDLLSLEIMTFNVAAPEVLTKSGFPVTVDGVAQIKVKGDAVSIRAAAEQFLSKTPTEIQEIALQTLIGSLREIVGRRTVEEVSHDWDKLAQHAAAEATTDLMKLGLQIVSFTIKEVRNGRGRFPTGSTCPVCASPNLPDSKFCCQCAHAL